MKEMIVILLSAILTQNFVLSKTLGICPFLGVSKKLDSAVGMSVAVTFVMALKKFLPPLYEALGIYLPLITTNCAVLGVAVLNIDEKYNFGQSMVNALGAGLGFLLAMVLFAGVRGRMENMDIPESFQGLPITLIAASIVSMSFMGFSGVVDGLLK